MGDKKLSTSDIITLAAGAVMLIAGFLPFWTTEGFDANGAFGEFAFPASTFVWLCGIAAGVLIALTKFANVKLPEKVLDFTWEQIHLVLGGYAALVMVFWVITDSPGGALDKGVGFWLLALGGIALVIGAVIRIQESPSSTGPSAAPPTPF